MRLSLIMSETYNGSGGNCEGVLLKCVAGENACPPEDCGGAGSYMDNLTVMADKELLTPDDFLEQLEESAL